MRCGCCAFAPTLFVNRRTTYQRTFGYLKEQRVNGCAAVSMGEFA